MFRPRRPIPRLSSPRTIARLATESSDGQNWYRDASSVVTDLCAGRWKPKVFAEILAITSRRVSVRRNLALTLHFLENDDFHPVMMSGVKASIRHWRKTGEVRGMKSKAFARAIMGDMDATVLDVWMARAFGIDQSELARPAVYAECSKRVVAAAELAGMKPAETQSCVWHTMIRRRNRTPRKFSDFVDSKTAVDMAA